MSLTLSRRTYQGAGSIAISSPLDVLLVVLALAFAMLGLRPLGDPDVWWHLRTGQMIIQDGFTTTDPWSHASTNPWLLHEWGTEVVMYLSYALGGYRGVIILHALGLLALGTILLTSIRRVSTPFVAVVIGSIAFVGVFLGTAERPQLASWCLLAAVMPALRRAAATATPPWWLIPVIGIWANLHGLWAAALVIYGFLTLGLVLEVGLLRWSTYRSFVAVGVLALGAVTLNPNGPKLLLAPLHVREYAPFVIEWRAPSLLNPYFAASFLLLAIIVVSWARSENKISRVEIAFVLGSCFVSLPYIRTMPILAITLAPLAAQKLSAWGGVRQPPVYRQTRANLVLSTGLVLTTLVAAAAWLPHVPPIKRGAPWKASAELDDLHGRAKVLNEYRLGGWLLWTARDTSPAVDGRTEIYSPKYLTKVLGAIKAEPGWRTFVRENDLDAAWITRGIPLQRGLTDLGWTVIFRDEDMVIMVPPAP